MHHLQNIYNWITRIIIPHKREVESLLNHSVETFAREVGKAPTPPFGTSLFPYKHPLVRLGITELKYHGTKDIARLFAEAAIEHIYDTVLEQSVFDAQPLLLVPIPRSRAQLREYGFCQTELIAKEIQKHVPDIELCTKALYKKDIPAQTSLSRENRLKNVRDAFGIADKNLIKGRSIILLDDVITTGATLTEARRVIRDSGGHVVECLAIGH